MNNPTIEVNCTLKEKKVQKRAIRTLPLSDLRDIVTRGDEEVPFCACRFCAHRDRTQEIKKPRGISECPNFEFYTSGSDAEDERRVIAAATKLAA